MCCAEDIEIVILTWNRVELLQEALASALRQTLAPHRIIVVDNASDDGTCEFVASIAKQNTHIHLFRQPVHVDACANMLTAVGQVQSKYFIMMHDDDLLDRDCIAWMDALVKAEPNVSMVYSSQKRFSRPEECVDAGVETLRYEVTDSAVDFVAADFARFLMRQENAMCFPSILYSRTSVSTSVLRNNRFGKIMDRPFVYSSTGKGSIVRLCTPLYHYRIHPGQDTGTSSNGPYPEEILKLLEVQRDIISANPKYARMFASLSIRLMKSLYFWGGNPKSKWRDFVREARKRALTTSTFSRPWRNPFWKYCSRRLSERLFHLATENSSVRTLSLKRGCMDTKGLRIVEYRGPLWNQIKDFIDRFLLWRNLWWWPRWKVPSFLMLHSVGAEVIDPCCPNNTIRSQELRNLVAALRKEGYTFKTFKGAIETGDCRTICLAFDDGYVDSYKALFPILKELQIPATIFVTNRGNPDFPRERWSTEDPIPEGAEFLTAEMMREMEASGLVEIGGHTAGHTTLTRVSLDEAKREIEENKRWIESVLGHEIVSFCYPRGGENDEIVSLVKGAGYKYAAVMKKKMQPVETDYYRIHRQIIPRGMPTWKAVLLATRGKWKL